MEGEAREFEYKGIAGEGRIGFDHSLVYLLTRMRPRFRKNFDSSDINLAHSQVKSAATTLTCSDEQTVIAEFKAPKEFFEGKFALNNGDTPAELLIMNAICNKALDWIVAINPRFDGLYEVGANKRCLFQYSNQGVAGQVSSVVSPACYDKQNVPTGSIWSVFSFLPKVVTENGLVTITCDKKKSVKYIAVAGSEADPSEHTELGVGKSGNSEKSVETGTLKGFCRVILRTAKITKRKEQVKFSKLLDGIKVADTEREWEITNSALSETAGLPSQLSTALFTVTTKQPPSRTFLLFGRSCRFRPDSPATSSACWKDYARNMKKPQVDCSFNLASVSFEGPSPVSISHPVLLGTTAGKPYLVFPC